MSFELRKDASCFLRILGRRYRVTVLGVSKDTFWVTFPLMDYPLEGMGVDLEFHDEKGYHIYHTRVSVGPEIKGGSVVLQRSESIEYRQHRTSWRVPTEISTDVLVRPMGTMGGGWILNLGSKGALLKTDLILSEGDLVDLAFPLPDGAAVDVRGQILRTESDGKYGLIFLDVSPEANKLLVQFVWQGLRDYNRKEMDALYPRSG